MQLILIVQGQPEVGEAIRYFLEQANYAVRLFNGAKDLVAKAERQHPALMFIELGATAEDGRDLHTAVRSTSWLASVPLILFSSAANSDDDENRIQALESGADDYVGQPLTRRELIARVQAVLRRFRQSPAPANFSTAHGLPARSEGLPPEVISLGEVRIDASAMKVFVLGAEVPTTTLEFRLIYYLAKHQHRVFTRDQLLDAVWGGEFVTLRSVDACIRRIRRKIEPDRTRPTYLKTIRGAGYLLDLVNSGRDYAAEGENLAIGA